MLRAPLGCRLMKPARSRVSTICWTEGGQIFLQVGFRRRPAMQPCVEVDKRQILPLLGRDVFCSWTHAGHPFVQASHERGGRDECTPSGRTEAKPSGPNSRLL
jgi:hypothetical protein